MPPFGYFVARKYQAVPPAARTPTAIRSTVVVDGPADVDTSALDVLVDGVVVVAAGHDAAAGAVGRLESVLPPAYWPVVDVWSACVSAD